MLVPGTPMWNITLDNEANDAASLFSHGLAITAGIRRDYHDAVAAMSLLALGTEKLVKLTIGIARVDRGEGWPSRRDMRNLGHGIVAADGHARATLDLSRSTAPVHLDELRRAVEADPVVTVVLAALERFGENGRFFFLDSLGDSPQQTTSPHMLWAGMVSSIMRADPQMTARMTTPEEMESRADLNEVIVASLTGWWEFYRAAWTTGAIGENAKKYSQTLRLAAN
ncbi:hypothetical protein [Paractinoplanes brasiliensis]|uniref:Uncharacterized protein n=1 Tax=Paractinoplanes brasiliensis TaxID=52695 RepID=A0A4V6PSW4_9ACTN|nr:hypothetical protein [Actinoplanes brasiliensis]TDO39528.1 hypothetical protein C8E87_3219 [Actinoplanes brasiliensis]GID29133.1 hypothetical protein Abr02nite_41160 [Actinoplanes brasiliensis]